MGITAYLQWFLHECRLHYRERREWLQAIWFFFMTVMLFPLTIDIQPVILQKIAPGVLWVAAALSSLLSLDKLFSEDAQDGSLEHLISSPSALSIIVFIKILVHWLMTGIPLLIATPLLALMLQISASELLPLWGGLALGTLLFSFLGSLGAAAIVNLRHGGVLLSLLVLPLYIPVLILGVHTVSMDQSLGAYLWLSAGLCLAIGLVPFAVSGLLRVGNEVC